jgi:hypothetical protein
MAFKRPEKETLEFLFTLDLPTKMASMSSIRMIESEGELLRSF